MKKILAIAITTGLSAPVLADTTVYGQLHVSYDALSADGGVADINSVASNSSRIGVKGSAELNAGLKAIYQAEWGMDTGGSDTDIASATKLSNGSGLSRRNQVVGLAGGFGAVLVGRHDTPFKAVGRKADLFWSTQLGQNRSVTNPGVWDLRANNVIAYQTPKMGGFQALGAYITDLGTVTGGIPVADKSDNTVISVNGFYNAGPLMLGAGYEKHNLDSIKKDRDSYRLVGSYKIGAAKLVGYYQDEDNGGLQPDASVFGVGAAYKVGAGTIKGQYYERDIDNKDNDPALIAIGYDHKLGSKTEIYGQYATVSEGGKLGGAGHGESISAIGTGDADGISFGIRHKF